MWWVRRSFSLKSRCIKGYTLRHVIIKRRIKDRKCTGCCNWSDYWQIDVGWRNKDVSLLKHFNLLSRLLYTAQILRNISGTIIRKKRTSFITWLVVSRSGWNPKSGFRLLVLPSNGPSVNKVCFLTSVFVTIKINRPPRKKNYLGYLSYVKH
jgi:hypothetical protein